ncbi:MAG TPA: MCP four helix bundle domain-containing protein [Desulfobaccales bacterium]|nr:MCP four helix bundle domain-containing protein [Desulfobaccales bacterium]
MDAREGAPVWPWDCGRRAREGKDAMTEISVKTKLWSLIAVMLLLIIGVGAVGFVNLDRGAATLKEFIDQDAALQNLTSRVHLNITQLRRFEKDYFLNIGHPEKQQEYLLKYQEIDTAMPQLLDNWTALARADVHLPPDLRAKAAALPARYVDYRGGFYATVQRLKDDPNLTPQQANVLMAKFKADIPILENDMAAVTEAVDRMEMSLSAQTVKRAREARMVIAVVILIAIMLAGLLGAALYRSICRAIFREGVRRMSHRI